MTRHAAPLRRLNGFTLIEMAIVLIIIGLIIGSVLKGQDLIDNARGKKFINFMRQGEVAFWTAFDRLGRFPGDPNATGLINATSGAPYTDITNASIDNFTQTLTLGPSTFILGAQTLTPLGASSSYNALCIAKSPAGSFSPKDIVFGQMLDVAIDSLSDGASGKVVAMANCSVASSGISSCATTLAWSPTATMQGVCYLFDAGKY